MTATLAPKFVVTDEELQVIAARIGVQTLPVVLGIRTRRNTETELLAAFDHATRTLADRGLISAGEVLPDLVPVLRAMQRPDRELAMRLVTPDGNARVTVLRRGSDSVSARRIGNEVVLEVVDGGSAATSQEPAVRSLLRHLPASPAADVIPFGAPLDALGEALSDSHDATRLSDRIRALGAEARTALLLGSALATRQAFAEIVYYALDREADRVLRSPAAVGVFYTKRGRIVSAPSASPRGQLWTTLKPGSDHAIKQAIGRLVELSTERWEDS
ncbi:ESX secretion-associated protein EspG [Mycobacterium sp. LTG2003]